MNDGVHLEMHKICKDLRLEFDANSFEDWGICYADAERAEEFLNYYLDNEKNFDFMDFEMIDLVIASSDKLLKSGGTLPSHLLQFLKEREGKFEVLIDYWKSLDGEVFPLANWLKQRFH